MENYFLKYLLREANDVNMNDVVQQKDIGKRVVDVLKQFQQNMVFDGIVSPNAEKASVGINIQNKTIKGVEIMKINNQMQKTPIGNVQLSGDIYSPFEKNLPEYRAIKMEYEKANNLWKIWILPKDNTKNVAKVVYKDGNFSRVQLGIMKGSTNSNNNNNANANNNNQQQQANVNNNNNQQQVNNNANANNNNQQQVNNNNNQQQVNNNANTNQQQINNNNNNNNQNV